MTRAVVFAYHDVGVRCLAVLLAQGVEVPLVVTHQDDPGENLWFESVARFARLRGIPVLAPEDPNRPELIDQVRALAPELIFSFYYRALLGDELLRCAARGALNMHGSLLPKYRGRAPVNWAIIKGERETGASLHYMERKPDAGALVDQQAVPILPDDTALEVFHKVTWAAELVLHRSLPLLVEGRAPRRPLRLLRSRVCSEPAQHADHAPCFYWEQGRCYADGRDGRRLEILAFELDGVPLTPPAFHARYGARLIALGDPE